MIIYSVTLCEIGSYDEDPPPSGYYKHKSKAIKEGERLEKESSWKYGKYKYFINEITVNEKE